MAWFAGGFGLACLLCCYGMGGIRAAAAAAVLCLAAAVLWWNTRAKQNENPDVTLFSRPRRITFEISRRLAALCLGGVLAFGWFAGYSALFYGPTKEMAGMETVISGTVGSYPDETSIGGYSVILRLDGGVRSPDVLAYGGRDWGGLKPGDRVICTARIKAADRLYGEETSYYTARGVFLLAYCNDPPEVEAAESVPVRYWPALCAEKLRAGIYAAFDQTTAPLAAAVTLGDKSGLDEQLHSALNRSGVMHAAVVSGLHISFLVSLILLLCGGNRRAALCLVPLLLFYALMAGGMPSALRAVIMQTALLAGPAAKRESDPPSALGLALLILLLQNPFAAASVSLQMSFASVAGILLVSHRLYQGLLRPVAGRLKRQKWLLRICRFVAASVSASLGAMLFAVPLIALYFEQISIVAPLTNVLVLWAVTILMVAALAIGTLAIFLPEFMRYPGMVFGLTGHYVRAVVTFIGSWPLASLSTHFAAFRVWLAAAYLQIPGCVFSKRRWRQAGLSLVCLTLLLGCGVWLNHIDNARNDLTITALDVGQGASTLLLSGKSGALVDCGGSAAASAGDLAADRLAAMGRSRLDLLVLTHFDSDHCNGVEQLLSRVEVGAIAVPDVEGADLLADMAAEEGAELILVTERREIPLGEAVLTLYPPLIRGASNEEGLFVLCSHGELDALITGDADAFVEKMLVKYCGLPDVEVLMVGHHGSRHSTCQQLLDRLRPEMAVISVGYNTYGHPAEETLERLKASGAEIWRTDENGAVTIALKDGMIAVN